MNGCHEVDRDYWNLAPKFSAEIELVVRRARKRGLRVGMFEGYRSQERQSYLYSLGRTRPGNIVTYAATSLESWHGFGLAADLVFVTAENRWTWDAPDFEWQVLHEIAQQVNLCAPISWDKAHVQPARLPISPPQDLRDLCSCEGLQAVWSRTGYE